VTRELVQRHWETANARDWEGFSSLLCEDLIYVVPQTRERIVGRVGYTEFFRTWPGNWRAEIVALVVDGDAAFCQIDFQTDGGPPETGIASITARDGRIATITEYWPASYEPPQRATSWIERF
jgi:ketosteroid isomerase-like protein